MRRAVLLSTVLFSMIALGSVARADNIPTVLRPGTHPWYGGLGLGGAIGVHNSGSRFKLIEFIGYHLDGNASGPALGFDIQESFGSGTTLELGPKFLWDIPIIRNLGLYLTPSAMIGYGYEDVGCPDNFNTFVNGCHGGGSFFDMQFGFEGKLMLADRAFVFFRPLTLDFGINSGFAFRWDIMSGGGVTF
jgi:hypothetical protein